MFLKGVKKRSGLSDVEPSTVTVVGFVDSGGEVGAITIDKYGRFQLARLAELSLPPVADRRPIGG